MTKDIWTVGHSTRPFEDFLGLLKESSIVLVADVRRFPGSRRFPQYNEGDLRERLADAGVGYRHFPGLGGRRGKRAPDSPNTAWRVEQFNAFADHMESNEFRDALRLLTEEASRKRAAVMCSEAVPWRCHRRIIADALTARGWAVFDIIGPGKVERHALTTFARAEGERVTYPAAPLFGGPEGQS